MIRIQGSRMIRKKNILITLRRSLKSKGGVRAYWDSLLKEIEKIDSLNISVFEMGGRKSLVGALNDQLRFKYAIKNQYDIVILNPSLGGKSFFRDALFARNLVKRNVSFLVFFHGWNVDFEKKVDKRYIKFFLRTFGMAKKIFVLSKDFRDKIIDWGYVGEIIIETTNVDSSLLTDFSIEKKISSFQKGSEIKILFLSRLLMEKGVFETVAAFKKLNKEHNNLSLFIAGDGEALSKVKNMTVLDKNIHVVGYVEGQDKIDLFKDCHIYCFPTFYGEGLPTSILEAMAFGMPIVTTNTGGLKEFFVDKDMGYLVDPKDEEMLRDKLELLVSNKDSVVEMGRCNYAFASENFLSNVVAKKMCAYIEKS